MMADRADTPRP